MGMHFYVLLLTSTLALAVLRTFQKNSRMASVAGALLLLLWYVTGGVLLAMSST